MKKLVLIIAILTFSLGFSQTEKSSKKDVANSLVNSYNVSHFEKIYNLFSEDYRKNKTLEYVISYFKRCQNSLGNITELGASYNEEGFIKFPIQLKKQQKTLVLKFNTDNKIDYISINKIKLN